MILEDSSNVDELGSAEPLREKQCKNQEIPRRKCDLLLQGESTPMRAKLELQTLMREFKALI